MDTTTTAEPGSREKMIDAMAEVLELQARVARAESVLATVRAQLDDSVTRLADFWDLDNDELRPLMDLARGAGRASVPAPAPREERGPTLRQRIVAVLEASPDEVYTPARLAPEVGSKNRDSVRNTLLVLAAKGAIEKTGAGQYRAKRPPLEP